MKKLMPFLSYVLVAVAAVCMTLSIQSIGSRQESTKLDELRALIDNVYVGQVDEKALEDGAAAGMVAGLGDRWSRYMDRETYAEYVEQMNNSYVGVGITVQLNEDGVVLVLRVEEGGPADEAGMEPGDLIVAVDGQDVRGYTIDDIKNMVRGDEGTTVDLTLDRSGSNMTLKVERRLVETAVVRYELLDDGIGLITIINFDSRCAEETIAAIEDLRSQGADKLLFDVRNNPGGYKHELVALLDYLLPEGPLFRSVDYTGKEAVDMSDASCLELPMAVLMNGDSYSAAEFFAAALREYGVATLVGQNTTGKGRFQSTYVLSDGSAATISVGTYCTPNGVDLTDVGLTPDISVEVDDETYLKIYYGQVPAAEDPQIRAAVAALLEKTP